MCSTPPSTAWRARASGTLHYATKGPYAFKNNDRAAGYLVQIAELGETNGIPMYAYDNGILHLKAYPARPGKAASMSS